MSITIRRAIEQDAPAILELNAVNNDARATVEHIAAHIREQSEYETPFVAVVDEVVVGLACLCVRPSLCDPMPYAELTELIVHPAHRRHGVGRALIEGIETEARTAGAASLVLMTAWRNTEAHAFYHALGFRLHTVMMQKGLD